MNFFKKITTFIYILYIINYLIRFLDLILGAFTAEPNKLAPVMKIPLYLFKKKSYKLLYMHFILLLNLLNLFIFIHSTIYTIISLFLNYIICLLI